MKATEFFDHAGKSLVRRYHKFRADLDIRYTYRETLVNVESFRAEIRRALEFLKEAALPENVGDYLEFGVCRGTTMIAVSDELKRTGLDQVRMIGFDSFQGLPEDNEGFWKKGAFNSDMEYTRQMMTEGGIDWERTHLVEGWFSDTLNEKTVAEYSIEKVSLINVDCDIYSAAKEALDFCRPLFADVAIINFDDWNPLALENKGEKRAFDEFLEENPGFKAEAFGEYSYKPGDLHGKLFVLRRT